MPKRNVAFAVVGILFVVGAVCCQGIVLAGGPPPCSNCGNCGALVDPAGVCANGACSHAPPCVDGCCIPNAQAYGFYPTQWRRWPIAQVSAPAPLGGQGISPPKLDLPSARDEISGPPVLTPSVPPGAQGTGPAPGLNTAPTPPADLKSPLDSAPSTPSSGLPESPGLLPGTIPGTTPNTLPGTLPSIIPETTTPGPSRESRPSMEPPTSTTPSPTAPPSSTELPAIPTTPDRALPLPSLLTPPETPAPSDAAPTTPDRSQTSPLGKHVQVASTNWSPTSCAGPSRDNPLREQGRPETSDTNPLRAESKTVANRNANPLRGRVERLQGSADAGWTPAPESRVVPAAHWTEAVSMPAKPMPRVNPLRTE